MSDGHITGSIFKHRSAERRMDSGIGTDADPFPYPLPAIVIFGGDDEISRLCGAGATAVLAPTGRANRAQLARLDPCGDRIDRVATVNGELVRATTASANGLPVGGIMTAELVPACEQDEDAPFEEPPSFDELTAIFREQADALKAGGVSFIAACRMHSLAECRAAMLGARETGLPVMVTITVGESGRTVSGASLASCVVTLQHLGAAVVGVEGFDCTPELVEQFYRAAVCATIPLAAIPNAAGRSPERFAAEIRLLADAGASVLGGCGATPEQIAGLRSISPRLRKPGDDEICSNESDVFFLCDDIMLSEPIECGCRLEDRLIDVEDERVNVAVVRVDSADDAALLAGAAHLSRLPVAILSDDADALDAALRLFGGRAIADSRSELDDELLDCIAGRYGALVY